MAVAHSAASESHTGATGSTSQASFQWDHAGGANIRGVLVFVWCDSATDYVTGVTYGGVAMTAVSGGRASDSAGEPGSVKAYFLKNPPTGTQAVVVSRTNNAQEMCACCAFAALSRFQTIKRAAVTGGPSFFTTRDFITTIQSIT